MSLPASLDLVSLRRAYAEGLSPVALIRHLLELTDEDTHHTWIHRLPAASVLAYAEALADKDRVSLPLYGVPFAIKDNIDLAGVPTTAACPEFAYVPECSAPVVERLIAAGAIPLGKTNLDQFATGLNGTRSPYGACRNSFNSDYISGGSSSGSAVAVAKGWVSFSLGTDTAGSGRVPAAYNNLVGLKPSCGLLPTRGVVPACRSLDSVSIFALTADDAHEVFAQALGFDAADAYSRKVEAYGFDFGSAPRFRFGVPRADQLVFFGDGEYEKLFVAAVARLQALGGERIEIDFAPFLETARLLYEGPWVAERYHAIRRFIDAQPEAVFPVTREITLGGAKPLAVDAFDAFYKLRANKRRCDEIWPSVDFVVTPSAGTIYTIAEMQADPIRLNSNLGYYTNFMNLLDYSAIALPAGFRADGLPFGVTLFAPAHQDVPLLRFAARWQADCGYTLGATQAPLPLAQTSISAVSDGQVRVVVCGAHLEGLPLNWQLTSRGALLVSRTISAPEYKLYALPGGPPLRPAMVRVAEGGAAIEVEVWELPAKEFGGFVAAIPAPLGIGKVKLSDGSAVPGFISEGIGIEGARDITAFGGWRAYLTSLK